MERRLSPIAQASYDLIGMYLAMAALIYVSVLLGTVLKFGVQLPKMYHKYILILALLWPWSVIGPKPPKGGSL